MELKITDLTLNYGNVTAVDHLSYTLCPGVYGLLGVNGAGKTTLMRMLTTLLIPSSGTIALDNRDIFEMGGEYRKLLGYLPQDFGFYPEFSVEEYLFYIASIKGLRPGFANQQVKRLLKQVRLFNVRGKRMKTLSGGMKRRAGIAQAMLNDPKILILDEPTAGLDPSERVQFRNLISEMAQDRIVLLSTHIVSDVEYIARDILLMKDGKLIRSGTSENLIASMPTRVWLCTVSRDQARQYRKAFQIANIRDVPGGEELRIIAPQRPSAEAVETGPSLEDVFLACFGKKGDENDDSL